MQLENPSLEYEQRKKVKGSLLFINPSITGPVSKELPDVSEPKFVKFLEKWETICNISLNKSLSSRAGSLFRALEFRSELQFQFNFLY